MATVSRAVSEAAATLATAGVASPLFDAQLLAAHVLGLDRMQLILHNGDTMPADYYELVQRRARREPLQHIVGSAPFGHLDLDVGPGVFVPRPETELLADWAVARLGEMEPGVDKQCVDLCTGSGALALYLATSVPKAHVTAVELDRQAAEWTERNIARWAPRVHLEIGDATDPSLLSELNGRCDLVVSNPPYVPSHAHVEPEVAADPHHAVFSGESGMVVIEKMAPVIARLLRDGGWTAVEHDDSTSAAVISVFEREGVFTAITAHQDFAGRDRFVTARKA